MIKSQSQCVTLSSFSHIYTQKTVLNYKCEYCSAKTVFARQKYAPINDNNIVFVCKKVLKKSVSLGSCSNSKGLHYSRYRFRRTQVLMTERFSFKPELDS